MSARLRSKEGNLTILPCMVQAEVQPVFFTILMIGPIKNVHQVRYAWHISVQVVHNVHFHAVKRSLMYKESTCFWMYTET